MPEYEKIECDVLVVGAGGAGLRAAIEASAAGVKVGVVSKSLLGKAHTVMAEGGMAAAMGNVDDRDNWRVHFADTMRGGPVSEQLAHGGAACQGSSGARAGAGSVGRDVRSHRGRAHSATEFRRASLSAAGACRGSDWSRDDPHVAGSRSPPGHRFSHGDHDAHAAQGWRSGAWARSGTTASADGSSCFTRRR